MVFWCFAQLSILSQIKRQAICKDFNQIVAVITNRKRILRWEKVCLSQFYWIIHSIRMSTVSNSNLDAHEKHRICIKLYWNPSKVRFLDNDCNGNLKFVYFKNENNTHTQQKNKTKIYTIFSFLWFSFCFFFVFRFFDFWLCFCLLIRNTILQSLKKKKKCLKEKKKN